MWQLPLASLLVFLCLAPSALAYVPAGTPSYTTIAPFNGQFALSLSLKHPSLGSEFKPHTCNATTLGAACNQPLLYEHDGSVVRINYSMRNVSAGLNTWKSGKPFELLIRLNYMPVSQVDRGWRKKNQAYPGYGFHRKWKIMGQAWEAFVAAGYKGSADWDLNEADEVTDALLYPEVCVRCKYPDGSINYCACSRRNAAPNALTVETHVHGSITPGLRGAAIALSIFGPAFLIVYTIADNIYYKRHGRALSFVRV